MNEQRLQDCLALIQALLDSPNEAADILNQNLELLDADFLNVLGAVVEQLEAAGNGDAAEFLKTWGMEIATALGLGEGGEEVQRDEQIGGEMGEGETTEALRVLDLVWREMMGGYNIPNIHRILQENLVVVNNWQIYPQLFAWLMIATLAEGEVNDCKSLAIFLVGFGNIIQQFPLGNRLGNLEIGIAAYEVALQVFTPEAFPQDWATTQNNLALAYRNRIKGEKAENLEQAIARYENALKVRTREAFPQNHAETSFNLGLAYQEATQWQNAYATFANAINTVEFLRGEIVSGNEVKQKHGTEWNKLYSRMVQTCLQLQRKSEAWEYTERSKTRILTELLATRNLYPAGDIPPDIRTRLQTLRQAIATAQQTLELTTAKRTSEPSETEESDLTDRLYQLRQEYNDLDPIQPVQFDDITSILDGDTAIWEWYITSDRFYTFILTHQQPDPQIWTSSPADLEQLEAWMNDYLAAYYAPRQAKTKDERQVLQKQWGDSLFSRMEELAKILHIDELLSFLPDTIQQLILIPHQYLHLLPLHALPVRRDSATEWLYLLDIFPNGIRYAPSCQLLHQIQPKQRPNFSRLFALQTPTDDLYEQDLGLVSALKCQFPESFVLKEAAAKASTLLHKNEPQKNELNSTITLHPNLAAAHCLFYFGHGKFDPISVLDSGLQLADDTLSIADIIAHFDLKYCRLVTLAACETNLTKVSDTSDEYLSLPFAFLLAGSTNVVGSLWVITAMTTAFLMAKFYENLEFQDSSSRYFLSIALKSAQQWLRDTTVSEFRQWIPAAKLHPAWKIEFDEMFQAMMEAEGANYQPYRSPYDWAGFCIVGKGE